LFVGADRTIVGRPFRPNLELFASRFEHPSGVAQSYGQEPRSSPRVMIAINPSTPQRRSRIWENMSSSPLIPSSPPSEGFMACGQKKTLEWACAAARFNDISRTGVRVLEDDGDETESEAESHEAKTPGELSFSDIADKPQTEDEKVAALMLCALRGQA